MTSGACDYDALLQHLRGTAADTVHELAAVLVVTSLSAVTDTSLLRVAHVACHLHGEFTLEDVAEVGGMPEPVVGDALELLHRKWRVLHRNYRNGHVYRYVAIVSVVHGVAIDLDTLLTCAASCQRL